MTMQSSAGAGLDWYRANLDVHRKLGHAGRNTMGKVIADLFEHPISKIPNAQHVSKKKASQSAGGASYFVKIIDDYSRYIKITPIAKKLDASLYCARIFEVLSLSLNQQKLRKFLNRVRDKLLSVKQLRGTILALLGSSILLLPPRRSLVESLDGDSQLGRFERDFRPAQQCG